MKRFTLIASVLFGCVLLSACEWPWAARGRRTSQPPVVATGPSSPLRLEVRVGGRPADVYVHEGRRYIEAEKGREYTLFLQNTSGRRIAVALAVDGLNTIDAKRTSADEASKWVINPYDSVEISGWQVSDGAARRFTFTSEEKSYGAAMGQTQNLGIISAVVFREKEVVRTVTRAGRDSDDGEVQENRSMSAEPAAAQSECAPSAAAGAACAPAAPPMKKEEYAATGMGREVDNQVERVALELEPEPCQQVDTRYEYRDQLIRLGVLQPDSNRLDEREGAAGFSDNRNSYCPQPGR